MNIADMGWTYCQECWDPIKPGYAILRLDDPQERPFCSTNCATAHLGEYRDSPENYRHLFARVHRAPKTPDVLTREVLEKARDAVLASCPCGGDRRHNCNGSEDYFEHLGRLQREEIARVERVMRKERDVPLKPPIRASLVPCQRPDRHPGHLFYDGLGDAAFWCDGVDWP